MEQTQGVAVVAAQLAATDRRALSQAWYSALHLAGRAPLVTTRRGASAAGRPRAGSVPAVSVARTAAADVSHRGGTAVRVGAPRTPVPESLERRSPRTVLARGIERGLVRRVPRRGVASFAIRTANGRIHLLVRAGGGRTRVIAVCRAELREQVERALAQARFALAARGVRTEVA